MGITPSRRDGEGSEDGSGFGIGFGIGIGIGLGALDDSLLACLLEAGATTEGATGEIEEGRASPAPTGVEGELGRSEDLDWRSCCFRSSQLRRTWAEVLALTEPKTWGWRRTILS